MITRRFDHRASVLIFALCTLSVLTAFAVAIGVRTRQSFTLISRLDSRDRVEWLARSGIQLARYVVVRRPYGSNPFASASLKEKWFNHPSMFKEIRLGSGQISLSYKRYEGLGEESLRTVYGFQDEGAKLNINTAEAADLLRLFALVGGITRDQAEDLAHAVVDWRQFGDSQISGFDGGDYYANLTYPYVPKKAPFENLSEVQLVKGMNPDVFGRLQDFITVYGDGGVNINTASQVMLMSLGMTAHTAQLVVDGRKGPDGVEATEDDFIFQDPGKISLDLRGFPELEPEELAEIDLLYVSRKIVTGSRYVTAHVQASLSGTNEKRSILCVFRLADGTITECR